MSAASGSSQTFRAAVALCLALVGAASMLYYHEGLFMPRVVAARAAKGLGKGYSLGDDFYPIWLTTRQWQRTHLGLYSPEMTREIQTGLFGRPLDARVPTDPPTDYRTFAYPAFTDLLFWPAATLTFPWLRIVLVILLPILTAASVWMWLRALDWHMQPVWFTVLVVLMLCNYQLLEGFFALQPGLIVGFLLAGSAMALRRGWLILSGFLLSMSFIKPQMALLATVYFLLWSFLRPERKRLFVSFFATSLLLAGASLWIWPHWIGEWASVLLGYPKYADPTLVILLPGKLIGERVGPALIAILLVTALWLAWKYRKADSNSTEFWWTLSILFAITAVAILPGQAVHDHVILFPGILLLVRHARRFAFAGFVPRTLLALGAVTLFWPWIAAFGVVLCRPWLGQMALSLPIRTAVSLPFAVLALLAYAGRITSARNPEPS